MPLTRIRQTAIGNDSITSAKLAHDLDLDGDFVRVPHGTTAERPSSPVAGYMRFNTTLGTLEQWNTNTNAWAAIDSPPIITSLTYSGSLTAADPAGGETITLTGSNFKSGLTIDIGATTAPTVTFVDSTSITFTTPAKTAGDYDVKLTNPNGLGATLTNGISYSGLPAFTTAAGNVGSISEDVTMSTITIVAAEPDGGTLAYSVTSGALPTGVTLGSANGQLTGTPNVNVTSDTTYNFTVTATDDENQTNSRAFNLIVLRPVYATQISNSLLFNDDDNSYLSWTPAVAGNRKTWTWSGWVKRGNVGVQSFLFSAGADSSNRFQVGFETNDVINIEVKSGGVTQAHLITTQVFRDPTAWQHIAIKVDTTQSSSGDRANLYVNGEEVTSFSTETYPNQNADLEINKTIEHNIGKRTYSSNYFDGYMSDIYFIDGQALDPTSFAEEHNGVWVPKSFSGTYGTNGYHLEFGDSSAIGDDTSGNTNDWTSNNFGVWNVVTDTPTNNFPVTNRRARYTSGNFSKGNLTTGPVAGGSGNSGPHGSTFRLTSGKWYCEMRVAGDAPASHFAGAYVYRNDDSLRLGREIASPYSSQIYADGSVVQSGLPAASLGTIYGFAVDVDNKTCQVYKDGSTHGTQIDWSGHTYADNGFIGIGHYHGSSSDTSIMTANYGQNPTFGNTTTAGGNADENGLGNFKYSVPSGFLAMCQKNLAEPSIDVKTNERPQDHFNIALWTGDGTSTRSITGLGFKPDFVWAKNRNGAIAHSLYDSVRGAGAEKELVSHANQAEGAGNNEQYGYLSSFDSDGFTASDGTGSPNYYFNENTKNYIAWAWKAGGAPTASNVATSGAMTANSVSLNGTLQSAYTPSGSPTLYPTKMSINTKAGFSIVGWTGDGNIRTIPHGLDETPEMMILKGLDARTWTIYHKDLTSAAYYLSTSSSSGESADNAMFNSTAPNSDVFTIGTYNYVNAVNYIGYFWHSIPGYSYIGKYTGSVNADGPYVDCGFKPAFILMRNISTTTGWYMVDNKIGNNEGNTVPNKFLYPNGDNVEDTPTGVDFYANGFKVTTVGTGQNGNTHKIVFMAFAEDPFKYSEAK